MAESSFWFTALTATRHLVGEGALAERLYQAQQALRTGLRDAEQPPPDLRRERAAVDALLSTPIIAGSDPPALDLAPADARDLAQTIVSLLVETQGL